MYRWLSNRCPWRPSRPGPAIAPPRSSSQQSCSRSILPLRNKWCWRRSGCHASTTRWSPPTSGCCLAKRNRSSRLCSVRSSSSTNGPQRVTRLRHRTRRSGRPQRQRPPPPTTDRSRTTVPGPSRTAGSRTLRRSSRTTSRQILRCRMYRRHRFRSPAHPTPPPPRRDRKSIRPHPAVSPFDDRASRTTISTTATKGLSRRHGP